MIEAEIVDCHHHLWDLRNHYPWLQENAGRLQVHGDDSAIRKDYLVADLKRDAAGLPLTRSVHVDAGAADGVAEARWLQAVADQHGFPHAIVAGIRLDAPDAAGQLEAVAGLPNARGVRDILNWHKDPGLSYITRPDLMCDPTWRAGFARLEPLGLSFDLQVYWHQLADAARLAADFPSTRILLNHAGMPLDRDDAAVETWRDGLSRLAAQDNTVVKISGVGMVDHAWPRDPAATLRPIVEDCLEAFGTDRAMFGSNFPVDGLYSSYRELYAAYDEIVCDLSPDERAALFGVTASTAYRL